MSTDHRTTEPKPQTAVPGSHDAEIAALRAEVARLRELVGVDEISYVKLKTEMWAARDAAMGAELEAGTLRGRIQSLESALVRATRQSRYLQRLAISPLRSAKDFLRRL
jgi:capsule polysaccharide export protein KpsE/RkpR